MLLELDEPEHGGRLLVLHEDIDIAPLPLAAADAGAEDSQGPDAVFLPELRQVRPQGSQYLVEGWGCHSGLSGVMRALLAPL